MSRYYQMAVEIDGLDGDRFEQIKDAASKQWNFDGEWWRMPGICSTGNSGEGNLTNSETEEHFAQRLTAAIWKANKGFCQVTVKATCLENLPHEDYVLNEEEYTKFAQSLVTCKFCGEMFEDTEILEYHEGKPVCDDCWDERLRVTE